MSTASPVEEIFFAALEKPTVEARAAYLAVACGTDADLRRRVDRLLAAHPHAAGFLERPAAPAAPPEEVGTAIGPYRLAEKLGEGGMGTVWVAEQEHPVRRRVALKLIRPGMDTGRVAARFEAERQALALMDHPNIARVLDAGTAPDGRPYFAMEVVRGAPVTRYCDEHRLTPRRRLELFVRVCQAVQHAHQKGVIHRDLKPSNVLVESRGGEPVPKVIDFGVAKATGPKLTDRTVYTEVGAVVGTLEYMSPEQAELDQPDVDTRSDVYSLGVMLYELLTGTTPLERWRLGGASLLEALRAVREEEPPPPSERPARAADLASVAACRGLEPGKLRAAVRGELDWIVMKCLEKDRSRRYETADALARDVERHLADEPVTAGPPSAAYRFRKFARRNRAALATAAGVAAALVLGTAVSTWQAVRATRAEWAAREAEGKAEAEAEQARLRAAEANEQRQMAELHARLALLVSGRESLLPVREWLTKGKGDREALVRIARKVVAGYPADEEPWKLLAVAYEASGRHAEARDHFTRAVEESPASAHAHNRLAWLLTTCPDPQFRDPGRAVTHAREAVRLKGDDPWYWNTLGVAYYRTGDWRSAVEALRTSEARWDDGYNSFFLAMARARLGDHAEARWWYEQGLERQKPALPFTGTELNRIREEAERVLRGES